MASTTILTLPFAYAVSYVEPRKRNPETRILRAETPVEVRSVTADEAPEAYALTLPSDGLRGDPAAGTHVVGARFLDGRLFRPVGDSVSLDRFQRDVLMPSDTWRSGIFGRKAADAPAWSGDDYPRLPLLARDSFGRRNPMALLDYDTFAEHVAGDRSKLRFRSSDLDVRAAEARSVLSAGLLVVDGTVWSDAYASEPRWRVDVGSQGIAVDCSFSDEASHYLTTFRIDRKDEAVAYAHEFARRSGRSGEVTVTRATLDHCDPDLLRHCEVVSVARQALAGMGGAYSNRAQIEPWSEAANEEERRIRGFSAQGLTRDDAIDVLESVSRLRGTLMALPEGAGGSHSRQIVEWTALALSRWEGEMRSLPDIAAAVEGMGMDAAALRLI